MNRTISAATVDRRFFLTAAAMAFGTEPLLHMARAEEKVANDTEGLVDVNVSLSRWPWRRVPYDDTAALAARLRRGGVTQAWAGSFDALTHRNLTAVNACLADECRRRGAGLLVPFGALNPLLPDWEEDLRRCAEEHHMPGIRLHPNYHGYRLDNPAFIKLVKRAAEQRLIVQVALCMEDERAMNPLTHAPPVDATPLLPLLQDAPGLRLVLLNVKTPRTIAPLATFSGPAEVYLDIAMLEAVAGVERLLRTLPAERVCFGSHAPFFCWSAAWLKLQESVLDAAQLAAVRQANAARLLPLGKRPC